MAQKTKPANKKKVITKVTTTKLIVTNEKGKVEKVIRKPTKVTKKTVDTKKKVTKPAIKSTTKKTAKPTVKKTTVKKEPVKVEVVPTNLAETLPLAVDVEVKKKHNYVGVLVSVIVVAFIITMFFVML